MKDADFDYCAKVTSLSAVTTLPPDDRPYFGFSVEDLPHNTVLYVDLYSTDPKKAAGAQAIASVVAAAFVARVKLKVFLDHDSLQPMVVKWVQTEFVG